MSKWDYIRVEIANYGSGYGENANGPHFLVTPPGHSFQSELFLSLGLKQENYLIGHKAAAKLKVNHTVGEIAVSAQALHLATFWTAVDLLLNNGWEPMVVDPESSSYRSMHFKRQIS